MNEHLLIKKAKKGDVEAFGELYTTVYKNYIVLHFIY